MIRTQVYIEEHQSREIKTKAKITKKSEAEIIRAALEIGLPKVNFKPKGNAEGLQALVDLGKKLNIKGPPDLSTNLDDYLYGDKE